MNEEKEQRLTEKNKHKPGMMKILMVFMILCILCSFILNILLYCRLRELKHKLQELQTSSVTIEQMEVRYEFI